VQKGSDIDGEGADDYSGTSVSMPDSNTLAIGAAGNASNAGHVRIYHWNGNQWVQKGIDIDGEAAGDNLGSSISMCNNNTLAIGATGNDGNGTDAGHTRVYTFEVGTNVDNIKSDFGSAITVYPNPTNGEISIHLGANYNDLNVIIRNLLGQDILKKTYSGSNILQLNIPGEAGVYFIEVRAGDKNAMLKVMKE